MRFFNVERLGGKKGAEIISGRMGNKFGVNLEVTDNGVELVGNSDNFEKVILTVANNLLIKEVKNNNVLEVKKAVGESNIKPQGDLTFTLPEELDSRIITAYCARIGNLTNQKDVTIDCLGRSKNENKYKVNVNENERELSAFEIKGIKGLITSIEDLHWRQVANNSYLELKVKHHLEDNILELLEELVSIFYGSEDIAVKNIHLEDGDYLVVTRGDLTPIPSLEKRTEIKRVLSQLSLILDIKESDTKTGTSLF